MDKGAVAYAVKRVVSTSATLLEEAATAVQTADEMDAADTEVVLERLQLVIERAVKLRADLREQLGITLGGAPVPVIHDEGPTRA